MECIQERHKAILDFLKHAGLVVNQGLEALEGQAIPRDLLISSEKYTFLKDDITKLKQFLSSSRLTSLQNTAESTQRWPLLNAVRQILRVHLFRMVPFRVADGYSKDGKKIIKRFFKIEKMKINGVQLQDSNEIVVDSLDIDVVDNE